MTLNLNLLTKENVCELLSISPRGLFNMVAQKRFPAPLRIGKRDFWSTECIERWRETLCEVQGKWRPIMD
jgi:predicted DNA-binding transcriptional regulator AlpA